MKPLEYDDFDVLIESSDGAFRAKVVNSPGGETVAQPFVLPVTPEKLELLVLRMRTAHGVRALATDPTAETRQLGGALFDALFHDDLLDRLRNSLTWTDARRRGLRIRLRFSNAHELWNIPWELLYDKERHRFLCQFDTTPVVRYVDLAQPVQPLVVHGPIRMLVMISSPSDYPPLDVDKEWHQLAEALKPLVATGSLTVDKLAAASLDELRHTMMFGDFHVFHYIGHGGLDKQSGDGLLVLTGSDGRSQLATGPELFVMLANSPIRLAVLNSCQGAQVSIADPYAGTAASLVHQGIPAVIAMQFEISDHAAIAFSRTLYEAIAYGWPVDIAVGEARRAILATSKSEWATPVLYLRAPDGHLVEITKPDRAPAPGQPTGLAGSVTDQVVALRWAAVPAGLTPVNRWEVRRDGIRVGDVTEPRASDQPSSPGSYKYTVVAVGADGQRSTESEAWIAAVRNVISTEIPQPTGLSGSSTEGRVDLYWDMIQPGSPRIAHWEIFRDGALVNKTKSSRTSDLPPEPGSYAYAVVAVGVDGQRSPESATWTASVPVLPPALGPPQVPAVPTGLGGSIAENYVDLHWDLTQGSRDIARWEIFRDGALITEATSAHARDVPPDPGSYRYTVVAVGEDGQRSAQTVPWTAEFHPARPSRWLVRALAIALAAILAGLFLWAPWRQDGTPPTGQVPVAPAGLTGDVDVSGTKIDLRWDPAPSDSAAVSKWEIRRDGDVIGDATETQATVPNEGFYSYTLVAIGEDGQLSAESNSGISPPVWQQLRNAGFQEAFSAAGVAEHNGELWIVGGQDANGKRNEVRVFDPQTGTWRDGPKLPIGVSHAPLVSTGERLYLLGGITAKEDDKPVSLETVYSLDTEDPEGTWIEDEPLPAPRASSAAAWDGQRLVMAGGAEIVPNAPRPAAADIWELQSGKWEGIGELQPAREHLAAVTNDDGTIWFIGGADHLPRQIFDDVDVLSGNNIVKSTPISNKVQGMAAIWTSETGICVFGGSTVLPNQHAMPVAEVECLDGAEPDPGWPDLPEPRNGAGAAVIDKTVYVVGGASEAADMVRALRFG